MKKIATTLLIITLLFTVGACGQKKNSEPEKSNKAIENNKNGNNNKKDENVKKDNNTENEDVKKKTDDKLKEIKSGEVVNVENYCEFKVNSTQFGKRINPPNPQDIYVYYEAKDQGKTYLDCVIDVKNLLTEAKRADEILSVKVIYDNKYEYETFSAIEENGGSNFTYTNITSIDPLTNGNLHFLATVPEEIENDDKPLAIIINAKNQEFKYNIR